MTAQATINDLASAYQKLANTQQQMSSGLRSRSPPTTPTRASRVVSLNGQLAQLTGYSNSVSDATSWAKRRPGRSATSELGAARARAGRRGGQRHDEPGENASAATEVNQLIDAIKSSANTTYNGSYIFGGTRRRPALPDGLERHLPGQQRAVSRAIGPGVAIQVNGDISQLLGNGTSANDGKLLDTLRTIASDLGRDDGEQQRARHHRSAGPRREHLDAETMQVERRHADRPADSSPRRGSRTPSRPTPRRSPSSRTRTSLRRRSSTRPSRPPTRRR